MSRRLFSLSLLFALLLSCGEKEKVDPRVEVASVSLNKSSIELIEGESFTLTATVSPSNATDKTITWTSSNTAIATVSGGNVTAVKEGSASITAACGGKTASCAVTVNKKTIPVSSVTLNKTSLTLVEGESFKLTATVSPSDATDPTVTWSSSDPSVATVSGGEVTAVKPGSATVTAKSGDKSATCAVTVEQKIVPVSSVTLSEPSRSVYEGRIFTLTATVLPETATNKQVTWSSSNSGVATVDADGTVKARKAGKATIKVTTQDGKKTADCSLTVKKVATQAVDLGLSIKWGTCNVGADQPEEYGDYYAWGETETYYISLDPLVWKPGKTGYDWESYNWGYSMAKYNSTDGKSALDLEDDAAHVNLGGKWRMPSREECNELMENCTWTDKRINGVWGKLVTGKNGNSIFLPFAGKWCSNPDIPFQDGGSGGHYWSNSIKRGDPNSTDAMFIDFNRTYNNTGWYGYSRCFGHPVRPVTD